MIPWESIYQQVFAAPSHDSMRIFNDLSFQLFYLRRSLPDKVESREATDIINRIERDLQELQLRWDNFSPFHQTRTQSQFDVLIALQSAHRLIFGTKNIVPLVIEDSVKSRSLVAKGNSLQGTAIFGLLFLSRLAAQREKDWHASIDVRNTPKGLQICWRDNAKRVDPKAIFEPGFRMSEYDIGIWPVKQFVEQTLRGAFGINSSISDQNIFEILLTY